MWPIIAVLCRRSSLVFICKKTCKSPRGKPAWRPNVTLMEPTAAWFPGWRPTHFLWRSYRSTRHNSLWYCCRKVNIVPTRFVSCSAVRFFSAHQTEQLAYEQMFHDDFMKQGSGYRWEIFMKFHNRIATVLQNVLWHLIDLVIIDDECSYSELVISNPFCLPSEN